MGALIALIALIALERERERWMDGWMGALIVDGISLMSASVCVCVCVCVSSAVLREKGLVPYKM